MERYKRMFREEETGEEYADEGIDNSDIERLLDVIKEIAHRDDLVAILNNLEDPGELADHLESALNSYEAGIEE